PLCLTPKKENGKNALCQVGFFLAPLRNLGGNFIGRALFHTFDEKVRGASEHRSKVCVLRQMPVVPSLAVLPAVQAERAKILLVEDEVLIRMMLADEL